MTLAPARFDAPSYLRLRDLDEALRNDQPFIWHAAMQAGADLRCPGGEEVMDRLFDRLGLYEPDRPSPTPPGTVPGTSALPAVSWLVDALNEVLSPGRGVSVSARSILRLYRAGRTEVLDRLFAQTSVGLDAEDRGLLLCQAALLREWTIPPEGPRLQRLAQDRRDHLLAGLACWGLPSHLVLDPVRVAHNLAVFHLGRVSLRPLDGPEGLSAWFSNAITVETVKIDPRIGLLVLADHWLGPLNVMESLPVEEVRANRRRMAVMVERCQLQACAPDQKGTGPAMPPRSRL